MSFSPFEKSKLIKALALEAGFLECGISKAEFLKEDAPHLEKWLKNGMHGKMHYMENHFDMRLDPSKLVPGAKSVISLLYNYYPEKDLTRTTPVKIAKYAYGQDYHHVIKSKLRILFEKIKHQIGDIEGRCFVDSAPVMERAWAKRSGLGWIGKNSLLLNKQKGSYFFIAEIISDLELEPDGMVTNHCGTCTKCLDACPTEAIPHAGVVDAQKCISYLTIELREAIPDSFIGKMNNWAFGCDICQDVCPWNRFSKPHNEPLFQPHPELEDLSENDWKELTEEVFGKVFKKSAVKRAKYEGLKKNIRFITS